MRKIVTHNADCTLQNILYTLGTRYTNSCLAPIQAHAEYPHPSAVLFMLQKLEIPHTRLQVDLDTLVAQTTFPIIAQVFDFGGILLVITGIEGDEVHFLNEDQETETMPLEHFKQTWSGFALGFTLEQAPTQTPDYPKHRLKAQWQGFRLPMAVLIVLGFMLIQGATWASLEIPCVHYVFFSSKALGISVSVLLLLQLFNHEHPLVQKICTADKANSKRGCEDILNGKAAYFLGHVAWSEIGFVYFTSLWLSLLFLSSQEVLWLQSILALLAVPYIIWSLWYQFLIAKKWCPLCLAILSVLLLDAAASSFYLAQDHFRGPWRGQAFAGAGLIFGSVALGYAALKPIISGWMKSRQELPRLYRMKHRPEVFEQLIPRTSPKTVQNLETITLGNPKGNHELILVINPGCEPCNKLQQELLPMLRSKKDTVVHEVFMPDNPTNFEKSLFMLQVYLGLGASAYQEALVGYYANPNFEQWQKQHAHNLGDRATAQAILESHLAWCKAQKVFNTPTLYFRGYYLPEGYTLTDLDFMIT